MGFLWNGVNRLQPAAAVPVDGDLDTVAVWAAVDRIDEEALEHLFGTELWLRAKNRLEAKRNEIASMLHVEDPLALTHETEDGDS